jgi:hypothetical protein
MLKYLFLKQVPIELLVELLETISTKTNDCYLIDMNVYRKLLFYNLHTSFCESLIPYYHVSKRYYLTREMTYNSFTNIVRQICKSNQHPFYTELKYDYSIYTILYFISFIPKTEMVNESI